MLTMEHGGWGGKSMSGVGAQRSWNINILRRSRVCVCVCVRRHLLLPLESPGDRASLRTWRQGSRRFWNTMAHVLAPFSFFEQ